MHAAAKIPDKAWLLEIDRTKLHVRLQIDSRLLEKLLGREKPGHERRNDNGNRKINRSRCKSAVLEKMRRVFRGQPASKQKRHGNCILRSPGRYSQRGTESGVTMNHTKTMLSSQKPASRPRSIRRARFSEKDRMIRVLIAAPSAVTRAGLKSLLEEAGEVSPLAGRRTP